MYLKKKLAQKLSMSSLDPAVQQAGLSFSTNVGRLEETMTSFEAQDHILLNINSQ